MDLFLLIGQSNMAGRAPIDSVALDTLQNVFLFTGEKWEPAANPLNKYSTVRKKLAMQQLGMGYSFAKKISECTDKKIGLVVNARGGTAIEWWLKGYEGPNDFNLYEEAVKQIKKAMKYGKLKGIIWHQGEANRKRPDVYMSLLTRLVSDLREDLDVDAFFLAGEIGRWRENTDGINSVIDSIPQYIHKADYVSSDQLTPRNGDLKDPHFDAKSQLEFGKRYADIILSKVYNQSKCK